MTTFCIASRAELRLVMLRPTCHGKEGRPFDSIFTGGPGAVQVCEFSSFHSSPHLNNGKQWHMHMLHALLNRAKDKPLLSIVSVRNVFPNPSQSFPIFTPCEFLSWHHPGIILSFILWITRVLQCNHPKHLLKLPRAPQPSFCFSSKAETEQS